MESTNIITIQGIECYEENGVAYLNLEAVARGLGFTLTEHKNGKEYCSIKWQRVYEYLADLGFVQKWTKEGTPNYHVLCPEYIPENIFYRLAMKAKNAIAEKFQALVADEIIPQIRKTGMYLSSSVDSSFLYKVAAEMEAKEQKIQKLSCENTVLNATNQIMKPKAEYYDALVDHEANLTLTEAARVIGVSSRILRAYCLILGELYYNKKSCIIPTNGALN